MAWGICSSDLKENEGIRYLPLGVGCSIRWKTTGVMPVVLLSWALDRRCRMGYNLDSNNYYLGIVVSIVNTGASPQL
jgi:hypothetical protein